MKPGVTSFPKPGLRDAGLMILLGILLTGQARASLAQSESNWRAFNTADGLAQSECAAISLSPQGAILAVHPRANLVSIFDGYSVITVFVPEGIVGTVQQSAGGQLWALATGGLHELRNNKWVRHQIEGEIIAVHPTRQHHALVLLRDRLIAFDAENTARPRIEVLRDATGPLGRFTDWCVAGDGSLWISAERGLIQCEESPRKLTARSDWRELPVPPRLNVADLHKPVADSAGGLIVLATPDGESGSAILGFDGVSWDLLGKLDDEVLLAWRSASAFPIAATRQGLYQIIRPSTGSSRLEAMSTPLRPGGTILDVAVEPLGAIWLATDDGLFRHAPRLWQSHPATASDDAPVEAVAEDRHGSIWFVANQALHQLDGDTHTRFPLTDNAHSIDGLFAIQNNKLVLWSENGLGQFDSARGVFESINAGADPTALRPLGLLKDGSLLVLNGNRSSNPGFEIYDGQNLRKFPASSLAASWRAGADSVFESNDGDLWLSSEPGVARLRNGEWQLFPRTDRNIPARVVAFANAAGGKIIAATEDRLWEFDGRAWSQMRAGFDGIKAMLRARDGALWVATANGAQRLTADAWVRNGIDDGLPSLDLRGMIEDSRGRLWIATARSLATFQRDADADPPRTFVEGLADSRGRVPEGETVALMFRAIDRWQYTAADRLLFSHRLDEREWSPFSESATVTLADLAPGKHYFQARAMDRNGHVDPTPARLAFTVTVPWYKEARLVVIAFTGMGVALFFAAMAFNRHRRLKHSYAEVERQVDERTRELERANRELLHSQKMNALGALSAGIAHDFNNILSIIKGSVQIIEDNPGDSAKMRTRLDRIRTVVQQGAGIVEAMLGFSRSSDEKTAPCDINAVVDDTIKLLGDRFLRETRVTFERGAGLPELPVPRDFVQQVLLNFIFNAAEAMSGEKAVVIRTWFAGQRPPEMVLQPAQASGYVAISVTDVGCGISPENIARVFEPFFTTKALSTRRGTGLGLSMVYELAKKLQAGLKVESRVGAGSTFTIYLPALPLPKSKEDHQPELKTVA